MYYGIIWNHGPAAGMPIGYVALSSRNGMTMNAYVSDSYKGGTMGRRKVGPAALRRAAAALIPLGVALVAVLGCLLPAAASAADYGRTNIYNDHMMAGQNNYCKTTEGTLVYCVEAPIHHQIGTNILVVDAIGQSVRAYYSDSVTGDETDGEVPYNFTFTQERVTDLALMEHYFLRNGESDTNYAYAQACIWLYTHVVAKTGCSLDQVIANNTGWYAIYYKRGCDLWPSDSTIQECYQWVAANRGRYTGHARLYVKDSESRNYTGGIGGQTSASFSLEENPTVSVRKSSSNESISSGNSCYSLQGAEYGVYSDRACGSKAATLTTGADGSTGSAYLAPGTYYVREDKAPKGYALDTEVHEVKLAAGESKTVTSKDAPQNDPTTMVVAKVDAETGKASPLGAGTLEGAEFTVKYYAGYYDESGLPAQATRTWVLKTDGNGKTGLGRAHDDPSTYLVSGDAFYSDTNGNYCLPLGTVTVQETKAPKGYLLSDSSLHVQQVTSEGRIESVHTYVQPTVSDQVKRGDLRLVKRSEDQQLLAGVPWLITSKTTGESHVAVTDENGNLDTSATRGTVNANDAAVSDDGTVDEARLDSSNGVWFTGAKGGTANATSKGALPYDTYTLQELRCTANAGMKLVKVTTVVSSDGRTVDLGTVTDSQPTIETQASDREMGGHYGTAGKSTVVEDTVKLENLDRGHTYTVRGEIVDSETGESVATAEDTFTAKASNAKVKLSFPFDSTALAGRTVTVLERLYEGDDLLASHEDLDDADQQVSFPEVRTKATGVSSTNMALAAEGAELTDRVSYSGLEAGRRYVLETSLVDAETGDAIDGGTASTEIVPEASSGEAEVKVTVDASALAGRSVVFLETLKRDGATVARHSDLTDADQTVRFPKVGTKARDGLTGLSEGLASTGAKVVDTVSYSNVEPGLVYTVTGTLRDSETGEPVKGSDGEDVTASATFTAESDSGEVEVTFDLDATALAGTKTVVFETLSCGGEVAKHEDLKDEGQTVSWPKFGTEARANGGGKTIYTDGGKVKVIDTVSYENLVPGNEYTVTGTLMDKSTGKALTVTKKGDDGEEEAEPVTATASLTPKEASGKVEVVFEFDASALGGTDAVAFEELSCNGKVVGQHKDLEDAKQTVYLRPSIATTAKAKDGSNEVEYGEDAEIVDTVHLKGLRPGRTYTLTATPMDGDSGTELEIEREEIEDGQIEDGGEVAATWSVEAGEGADTKLAKLLKKHSDDVSVAEDGRSLSLTVDGTRYDLSEADDGTWSATATEVSDDGTEGEAEELDLTGYTVELTVPESTDDGTELEDRKGLSAYEVLDNGSVRFTPVSSEVDVEVPVSIKADRVTGTAIVMFESLTRGTDGTEIAKHEDIEDEAQTVTVKQPTDSEKAAGSGKGVLAQTGQSIVAFATLAAACACALTAVLAWRRRRDGNMRVRFH